MMVITPEIDRAFRSAHLSSVEVVTMLEPPILFNDGIALAAPIKLRSGEDAKTRVVKK